MVNAPAPLASRYQPGTRRERVASAVLAAAIILIAVLLAIYQSGVVAKIEESRGLTTFDVSLAGSSPKAAKSAAERIEKKGTSEPRPRAAIPKPQIVIPNPEAPASEDFDLPGVIRLTRAEMKSADIGTRQGAKSGTALASGSGEGTGDGDTSGKGDGPGGVPLYNADWFRRPTDVELGTYLPKRNPGEGWGVIACRTVANNRVEDCQILGESPGGSGYGLAVLNAAWQFQVIPPRINAKPQIGAWVRIRITYSDRGARAG